MEDIMLFVKFVLFFGLEFTVLIVIGAVLVAGFFQIVQGRIRESRRLDEIALENQPVASDSSTAPRQT